MLKSLNVRSVFSPTRMFFLHAVVIENGHRGIKTEIVTKVVSVRAVNLSTGLLCTECRCEQLCDDDIFRDRGQLLGPKTGLRYINTEIVTKMVPVRAVDLSIIAFCTKNRRERFCDDCIVWIGAGRSTTGAKLGLKK